MIIAFFIIYQQQSCITLKKHEFSKKSFFRDNKKIQLNFSSYSMKPRLPVNNENTHMNTLQNIPTSLFGI